MPDPVTLFRDAGAALYGPRWQRDLAAALGVSTRSVRAWAAGEREIPDGVWVEVCQTIESSETAIIQITSDLIAAGKWRTT
jgi:hypothetical protein